MINWEQVKKRTLDGKVTARIKRLYNKSEPIKLLIYNNLCPGDILAMTPSLEAIHSQYPNRFLTDVRCFHPTLFDNNPRVTKLDPKDPDIVHLWTTYPLVNRTNQRAGLHFCEGYLDWFRSQLDLDLTLESNHPHVYLTDEEKSNNFVEKFSGVKNYIVFSGGWKNDYTIKRWPYHYMQEVVNHFKGRIAFAQIGLSKKGHNHKPLDGAINLIDKTSIRELMQVAYHAQAGIGPVTCLLHACAAFQVKYVSLHGAREPTAWTNYHTSKCFSMIGTLPCTLNQACWRSRVVPLNDGDKKDKRCCELPMVDNDGNDVAKCMWNIKPHQVIEYLELLIEGGIVKL